MAAIRHSCYKMYFTSSTSEVDNVALCMQCLPLGVLVVCSVKDKRDTPTAGTAKWRLAQTGCTQRAGGEKTTHQSSRATQWTCVLYSGLGRPSYLGRTLPESEVIECDTYTVLRSHRLYCDIPATAYTSLSAARVRLSGFLSVCVCVCVCVCGCVCVGE